MGMIQPRVSLAIPVYNEEAVVPELVRRTTAVLDNLPGGPHEIVFVNDGSSDRTLELLEQAAEKDARIVVVALSRNFGHQTALGAALDQVSGDVVVMLDGDLQDPPEAVPTLLETYQQGYDVVYVRRTNRKESWWLRACYYIFYRLLAALSSVQLPLDAGDFGLMSRRVSKKSAVCPSSIAIYADFALGSAFARLASPWNVPPDSPVAPSTVRSNCSSWRPTEYLRFPSSHFARRRCWGRVQLAYHSCSRFILCTLNSGCTPRKALRPRS